MPEPDIAWRPVGFREVFSLLDLDRYDEVLIECMRGNLKRSDEQVEKGVVELIQRRSGSDRQLVPKDTRIDAKSPQPIASRKSDAGRSLGTMSVGTAKRKYL